MSVRLSRRKIADYVANELSLGNSDVIRKVAALLITERRTREAPLIARDVEKALALRGTLVATTHSARELSDAERDGVVSYLRDARGAEHVEIKEEVDAHLLGGIRIDIPGAEIDTTIRRKLNELVSMKAEA